MKYTISTNDKEEALRAMHSLDLALALYDMDNHLRSQIKYHDKNLQDVRDKLWEIMEARGIDLDRLVS